MKDNSYLYGTDVGVPEIPADIIMRRVELLKEHLAELIEVEPMLRDGKRCNDVIKAIRFWETINERN